MQVDPHELVAKRVQVLLVDDSSFLRTAVSALLAIDGRFLVVGQASNGEEGLSLAVELQPDVIVSDLDMPVMDGVEFIQKQLLDRHLPIVVFSSAASDSKQAIRALAAGAFIHVSKPASVESAAQQNDRLKAAIWNAFERQ